MTVAESCTEMEQEDNPEEMNGADAGESDDNLVIDEAESDSNNEPNEMDTAPASEGTDNKTVDEELDDKKTAAPSDKKLPLSNKNILAIFWQLVSLDESIRIASTANLLSELGKSEEESEKSLEYVVARLVKGLASSRKAARQGYAAALVHVIQQFPEIRYEQILELATEHLVVKGSFKMQEERDAYFGQVFVQLVLVKAYLQKDDSINAHVLIEVVKNLVRLMKKKIYLIELCCATLANIIQQVDYSSFEQVLPLLEPLLLNGWAGGQPQHVYLAIVTQKKFKKSLPKKYISKKWGTVNLCAEDKFDDLKAVLMETTSASHPKVHCLWDLVLDNVFKGSADKLPEFWKKVVDEGLLASSHERKYLALNIVLKVLPRITAEQVAAVISPSVLRCIFNSCQSKDNYLFNHVKSVLSQFSSALSGNEDNNVGISLIKTFIGRHGNIHFDGITKSKTVEKLIGQIPEQFLAEYFQWLKECFITGKLFEVVDDASADLESQVKSTREWILGQLPVLLRSFKMAGDEEGMANISHFLFTHAYFEPLKKTKAEPMLRRVPKPCIVETTRKLCQQKFNSVLTELTTIQHSVEGASKQFVSGTAKDGELYAEKILNLARRYVEMPKYIQVCNTWTPEVSDTFASCMELLDQMKLKQEDGEERKGFRLLLVHASLLLFSDAEEAADNLKDVQTCYLKSEEKKSKKKKSEPHWTEVLVGILLSFLSQPSNLMRRVVDLVFTAILPEINEEAFAQLLETIKPKEKGGEDNFDVVADEEEDDVEEVGEEEMVKIKKDNGGEENEGEETNEEDTDDSDKESEDDAEDGDDDEEDDDEIVIDEKLKIDLKSALGEAAADDEDDSGDDSDGLDMDTVDPKLMKDMDAALANVFKTRMRTKTTKKRRAEARQQITHFKLRVLDLLELFVKRQPHNPLVLKLVEPLLELLKSSASRKDEQALFERAQGVYKNKLCSLHVYPGSIEIDVEQVHSQMDRLFALTKAGTLTLQISTLVSHGIIYLVRVLRGCPAMKEPSPLKTRSQRKRKSCGDALEPVVASIVVDTYDDHMGSLDAKRLVASYEDILDDFMTNRTSYVQPSLFLDFIHRFPAIAWQLSSSIPKYLHSGCNNFRKIKACELLSSILTKKCSRHEENLLSLREPLSQGLTELFTFVASEGCSLKARQVNGFVHLADVFIKETRKFEKIWSTSDWASLTSALSLASEGEVMKRSPQLVKHASSVLSLLQRKDHSEVKKGKKGK